VTTGIGHGDLAIREWDNAVEAASALTEDEIVANMMSDPDLHDCLRKGLYMLGVATLPGDAG
jgi:electron transfer flavoprotein alpha/beta subunit